MTAGEAEGPQSSSTTACMTQPTPANQARGGSTRRTGVQRRAANGSTAPAATMPAPAALIPRNWAGDTGTPIMPH